MQEMQEMWVRSLGWEEIPGGGCGNPFQSSCLENPMDREAWWATVHRVAESWTLLKWLSMQACTVRARRHHQDLQSYFLSGWAGWTFPRFRGQLMAELGGVRRGHALEKQICLIRGFFLPPHIGACYAQIYLHNPVNTGVSRVSWAGSLELLVWMWFWTSCLGRLPTPPALSLAPPESCHWHFSEHLP